MMHFTTLLPVLASAALSAAQVATPSAPGFKYLWTANVTLMEPFIMGVGPYGERVAIPIIGGTFSGPEINGTILNLGADWGWTDTNNPDGTSTFHPDTRYQLQTSDGANIYIQTEGPAQTDGTIHLREKLETGSPDYYWLNNIMAIGILTSGTGYVVIDTWQVTSPV